MSLNLNDIVADGSAKFQVVKNATTNDIANAVNNFENKLGYRKKNKTYAVGDIAYHSDLPAGWYLECTIAGTSGSSDLMINNPTVGGTASDGTVTWTVKSIFEYYHAHLTDCDDAKFSGIYAVPPTANNAPSNQWSQMITIGDGQTIQQLAIQLSAPTIIFTRAKSGAATIFGQWTQQEAIVAKSLGSNSYIKYASGLIMQWGEFAVSNQTVPKLSQEVTLPITFTSSNYSLSVIQKYGDESDSEMIFRILDEQTSNFTVTMFTAGTHLYVIGAAKWIAIGY